jgi:hypothetical protein
MNPSQLRCWRGWFSPYMDYSSLLRWQANLIISICIYEFVVAKVCGDFWSVDLILLLMTLFWLFVALVELLVLWISYFVVYEDFGCLWVACRAWVGTKVLVCYGHEWTHECWSLTGMCEGWWLLWSFSVGTLTYIKLIVTVLRAFCPPYPNDS